MAKAPLTLDWNDLLSSKNTDSPSPEIEIVRNNIDPGFISALSDHQISEKIQRISNTLGSNLREGLPDKGAKLRYNLRQLQDELDHRKLAKARKDAENFERLRESEARAAPALVPCKLADLRNDSSPSTATKSPLSFTSLFSKNLRERADTASNRSNREWRSITRDKCKNSRKSRQRVLDNRKLAKLSSQTARMSSISSPFQCASSVADKDSDCRITGPSSAGKNSFNSHSKMKAFENTYALDRRSTKVQGVVILDEEELEHEQSRLEDSPDDGKEAKIYYPSRDDAEAIELSYADIKCLGPEQYLISPIMNFYIRYLQKPLSPAGQPRGEYHFFNTYFFRKLRDAISCKGDKDACFLKLRRWWKGVNIFQKAYIFLPIHGDMHWSLVIICIPAKEDESGPILLHLDSLGMHPTDSILDVVHSYLKEEWKYINKNGPPQDLPIAERIWSNLPHNIEKKKLRVPQQKNEYDCGLFVLYFMERFIDEAPERLKMKDLAMFGSKWFQPEEASGLRKRIRDLLLEEFENARLDNGQSLDLLTSSSSSHDENDNDDDDVQQLIEV
ncbi:ubiquitin-like-specific protease 1D isoform X2 [Asparagus officinalis]|uniref:ubiquitin-like-specific protease 1D isoform X2 n=1 Tax=Asparagus officinalis TaxID=4686 RepID=UPI00098E10E3|nr:ubiquitin-like-specific protease 1D isoform X2 [Asparagus officinalis]